VATDDRIFELTEVPDTPGTYFNPKTEVLIVVDDSATIDQDVFEGPLRRAAWVRVSDEVPVDESARDEALEEFETTFHPGASSALGADEDETGDDDLDEDEALGEDDFDEEDVIDPNSPDDEGL
jgi:hypothetical protein